MPSSADSRPVATIDAASSYDPEPILCADLFSEDLDRAVDQVLAPFWRAVLRERPEFPGAIWFIRDNSPGEHLALRLHGPAEETPFLRELLESTVAERGPGRPAPEQAPLQWSSFERHPTIFDQTALGDDEHAVARFLQCLGHASHFVLETFRSDSGDLHSHRQNVLIRVLCGGLSECLRSAEERGRYLAYHRDWIVRFLVLWSGFGPAKAQQLLSIYRGQTDGLPPAALESLRRLFDETDAAGSGDRPDPLAAFRDAAAALSKHVTSNEVDLDPDPFTEGRLRPILFKLFHVVANQLGIPKIDEGFVHHLLVEALGGAGSGPFVLAPLFDGEAEAGLQETKAFTPKMAAFEEDYAWTVYVLAGCTDDRWKELFHSTGEGISASCGRALTMLRKGEVDAGKELLDVAEVERTRLARISPSMADALGRFYYGTLAYFAYLEGDHRAAVDLLDEAAACVARAIHRDRFLMPMAPLVIDIPLQKARVARRLGDWQEMEAHLCELRDVQEDRRPLCVLDDGETITYATLESYFSHLDLEGIDGSYRAAVDALLDVQLRRSEFRRRYAELYAPRVKLMRYP